MRRSRHYFVRKTHRYLGVILGIQFLMWTISGLYFSWTDLDEIHGDFQRRHPSHLAGNFSLVSPDLVFRNAAVKPDSIHSIEVVDILSKPYYHLSFFSGGHSRALLADATTGTPREAVNKDEAVKIAAASFAGEPVLQQVEYLTTTHGHHEYRKKPLPAWAVTFRHPSNTTIYVAAANGRVESFRNNKWRVFDFLWMGHTMDYQSRDDINNWLLRIFSLFGLFTVISGFALYFISSRWRKHPRIRGIR